MAHGWLVMKKEPNCFRTYVTSKVEIQQCGRELTMTDKHICAVKMYVLFNHYIHTGMACKRQNI